MDTETVALHDHEDCILKSLRDLRRRGAGYAFRYIPSRRWYVDKLAHVAIEGLWLILDIVVTDMLDKSGLNQPGIPKDERE